MGLFPVAPANGTEVTNANGTTFKYDDVENKWYIIGVAGYSAAEVDALLHAEAHSIASHNDTTATGAELETLTDGSETDLHSHAGGISEATFNAALMIGEANKEWVNGNLMGGQYNNEYYVGTTGEIININANDFGLVFNLDLPFTRGGKTLHYDGIRIGIADSDNDNYITNVRSYRWTDHQTNVRDVSVDHDVVNGKGVGEFTFVIANQTCAGCEALTAFVSVVGTNADGFGLSYLQFCCWYQ